MAEPCVYQLAKAFNAEFAPINTQLSPGAEEPFYKALSECKTSIIYSNQDFFSSALHEIAHWCIAGEERRRMDDYGYWYSPDGRTSEQQAKFFKVEVKPQAIEWAFHLAAKIPFQYSLDNLNNQVCEQQIHDFKLAVNKQLQDYFTHGFPNRALQMIQLLLRIYNSNQPITMPIELTHA